MPRIISLGEALIDAFADSGVPLREARALHPRPGGAPANVAVALARLGADVGFVGYVGADGFGDWLIDLLAGEGVDVSHFVARQGYPTMLAVVATPSANEQQFILYHGADTLLRPEELPKTAIQQARVLVYGGVTLTSDSRAAALQASQWTLEAGNYVIFDVNLRPSLWPDLETARSRSWDSIGLATVVKLNEVELEFLTGTRDPARGSDDLVRRGVQLCCVSLGAKGAYFTNGSANGWVPAFQVDVLDTTGSGDAFVAGLAHKLASPPAAIQDLDSHWLREMVAFANACGGLAATAVGAMNALPRLEAVERLLCTGREQPEKD